MGGDPMTAAPYTTPGGRADLEWPCRLTARDGLCPLCCSRGNSPEAQKHRRAVLYEIGEGSREMRDLEFYREGK